MHWLPKTLFILICGGKVPQNISIFYLFGPSILSYSHWMPFYGNNKLLCNSVETSDQFSTLSKVVFKLLEHCLMFFVSVVWTVTDSRSEWSQKQASSIVDYSKIESPPPSKNGTTSISRSNFTKFRSSNFKFAVKLKEA